MQTKDADQLPRLRGRGMKKEGCATIRGIAVVLLTVCLAACGGGSTRHLLSISIAPPTANGADFPLGAVQFTATGAFDKAPTTVTPLTSTWSISPSGVASIETSDGFAQCISTGTATITGKRTSYSGIFHDGQW